MSAIGARLTVSQWHLDDYKLVFGSLGANQSHLQPTVRPPFCYQEDESAAALASGVIGNFASRHTIAKIMFQRIATRFAPWLHLLKTVVSLQSQVSDDGFGLSYGP